MCFISQFIALPKLVAHGNRKKSQSFPIAVGQPQPQPSIGGSWCLPQVSIVRILARDEPRVQEGSRQQQCKSGHNVCAGDSHDRPGDVPPNIWRNEGQPDPCKQSFPSAIGATKASQIPVKNLVYQHPAQ